MIENLDQNQIMFILVAMAISAVIVGFMAGFFGIGGGLIMVPILFYIFSFAGIDKAFVMHIAIGTSFSIIIPNSIISTITHMKFKAVDFSIVKIFGFFKCKTACGYAINIINKFINHISFCISKFICKI